MSNKKSSGFLIRITGLLITFVLVLIIDFVTDYFRSKLS